MKKILFLIHDLGDGGAEKVLVNLVNNMDPQKFDITVMTLYDVGVNRKFLKPHIHYRSCFQHMIPGNSQLMKLRSPQQWHKRLIKDTYDIEVAYLEGPSARIISGCENKKTKLFSWIHVEQHTKENAARAFRNYKESYACYRRFHNVVCVAESVRQDFLKIYPELKNTIVRYNTNETDQILSQKDDLIEDNIFFENEIRLVGVGKIRRNKGFDKLARIHCRLRKEGYQVHTYLLGRGEEETSIRTYLQEQEETDSFTFLGYQLNPYKYISKCDIFVCTSCAEGFSTAATEALILGIPVVTTPVSGMEEMLGRDGECGIITNYDDESLYQGIIKMISNRAILEKYKERAKQRGKDFDKKRTVQEVEKLFHDYVGY